MRLWMSFIVLCFVIRVIAQDDSCEITDALFAVGTYGQVTPGEPNTLRQMPTINSDRVGEIPAEDQFLIINDPVCADNYVWWQVSYQGFIGWTVQGTDDDLWLEPYTPYADYASLTVNNLEERAVLQHLSFQLRYSTNLPLEYIVFSPDGTLVAGSVHLYVIIWDVASGEQVVAIQRPVELAHPVEQIIFSDDNRLIAWRQNNPFNLVYFYDLEIDRQIDPATYDDPVTDIAFIPQTYDVLIAQDQLIWYNPLTSEESTLFEFPYFSHPLAIDFNLRDDQLLVVVNHYAGEFSGRVYQWEWTTRTSLGFFEIPEKIEEESGDVRGALLSDGRYWREQMIIITELGQVQLISDQSTQDLVTFPNNADWVLPSPNSSFLTYVTDDSELFSVNLTDGMSSFIMETEAVAFNPAGNVMATTQRNIPMTLWYIPD